MLQISMINNRLMLEKQQEMRKKLDKRKGCDTMKLKRFRIDGGLV
jgi:hypothetical protein